MWGYGPQSMMGYGGWGPGGWMTPSGGGLSLGLLAVGVAALVWLASTMIGRGHPAHAERRSAGLDILEERLARGEISSEEFLRKKRNILGHGGAG